MASRVHTLRTAARQRLSGGNGNLAEQAVAAALAYRAQSPIIDGLLKEIGMTGGSLGGLTQAATPDKAAPLPAPKDE